VPLTLARLPHDAPACVVEIGMNHRGEIAPLAALACPHVGVITNIERSHIGNLGSVEAIAEEKADLLRALPPNGVAVLPAESASLPILRAACGTRQVITFGLAGDARLRVVTEDADGIEIIADLPGWQGACRVGAAGRHMAINGLAALTAMQALGFSPAPGAAALAAFHAVIGRGALRRIAVPGGQALLLDESYNASAASVRAALAVLRLQPAARRVVVLGDMLELGAAGPDEHRSLADDVTHSADILYTCGPLMQLLFETVAPDLRGAHMPDSATLAPIVAGAVTAGDAVLVKGSLGSKMRLVVVALEGAG
jgi:UDP-N-acetylmuramoyl-tripeptide--D-alanyl-D-alanine ligase